MKHAEFRGVGHGVDAIAFRYRADDPALGYITQYASDRPDETSDIRDWLVKQNLSQRN
jgi:hypothetical protein